VIQILSDGPAVEYTFGNGTCPVSSHGGFRDGDGDGGAIEGTSWGDGGLYGNGGGDGDGLGRYPVSELLLCVDNTDLQASVINQLVRATP
jgi:hypothetical protein